MVSSKDDDRDDEWFKEIYGKEYTGPTNPRESKNPKKRASSNPTKSAGESDEEEPTPDPNAVPTDFTSREAKVWEAKAKAVERNWKRRKEEELTCRICGETGHFPQGCPKTLGGNRKSRECVETIPVRDKRLKSRLSGSVVRSLEKDTGCRIHVEDSHSGSSSSFTIHLTGPDKITLKKAVGVVNNYLNELDDDPKLKSSRHSPPMDSLVAAQMQHIERLQQISSVFPRPGQSGGPGNSADIRAGKESYLSHVDKNQILDGGSPRALNGSSTSYSAYNHLQGRDASAAAGILAALNGRGYGLTLEERVLNSYDAVQQQRMIQGQLDYIYGQERKRELEARYDELRSPQTLEELERLFMYETRQLTQDQDVAEDKERARHHEHMKEIHEYFQQKLSALKSKQSQRRDEFLLNEQLRKQQLQQQLGYGHVPSLHSYGGSAFEQRALSDPQLLYSGRNDPFQGTDQHQELSGYLYGRKGGSSQSYAKSPAYDNASYPHDELQRYPSYR